MSATAPTSFTEAAELAYHQNNHRVVSFHWNDQLFYLKKAGRSEYSALKARISVLLCSLLFRKKFSKESLQQGDIHDESLRLQQLRAQGIRVPQIETETDQYLVLEDAGTPLEHIIHHLPPEEKIDWYMKVVRELALLHQQGQWHGGAQLRNHSVKNGEIYRIDFEEKFGDALPKDAVGAYDLFLLLGDILSRLDEQTYLTQGLALVAYYEQISGRTDVIQRLSRLMWIRPLLRGIARLLGHKVSHSLDARRTLRFFDVMHAYIKKND